MPIAILKYKLPDEQSEYTQARIGADLSAAAHEFAHYLRAEVKYKSGKYVNIQQVREKFYECFEGLLGD